MKNPSNVIPGRPKDGPGIQSNNQQQIELDSGLGG